MKIAIMSDIHSNLEALESVLADIKADEIYCLGDLVGYGPNPNEVVEVIRKENIPCIIGNHDHSTITGDTYYYSPFAAKTIEWTRKEISEENLDFLKKLKTKKIIDVDEKKIELVHGSPKDPIWDYVLPDYPKLKLVDFLKEDRVDSIFVGHSHIPFIFENENRFFVNVGSVGQPRDHNPHAAYAILDVEQWNVEIRRVDYDIKTAVDKIFKSELPNFLGERLLTGW